MCVQCRCSFVFMWSGGPQMVDNVLNKWLESDPNEYIENPENLPQWKKDQLKESSIKNSV